MELLLELPQPARIRGSISLPLEIDPDAVVLELRGADGVEPSRITGPARIAIDDAEALRPTALAPGTYHVTLGHRVIGARGRASGARPVRLPDLVLTAAEERVLSLTLPDTDRCTVTVRPLGPDPMSPCRHVAVVPVEEGRARWNGATWLPVDPDGAAGPFLVPIGDVRCYMAGDDWIDAGRPATTLTGAGDVLLSPEASVVERRVRVYLGDEPASTRQLRLRGVSGGRGALPRLVTDEAGWLTLRLAPGETRVSSSVALEAPLDATFHWPVDEIRF